MRLHESVEDLKKLQQQWKPKAQLIGGVKLIRSAGGLTFKGQLKVPLDELRVAGELAGVLLHWLAAHEDSVQLYTLQTKISI